MDRPVDKTRCFFAFDIPDPVVEHLVGIQEDIEARGVKMKRVLPANIHITLRFLGELLQGEVKRALEAAGNAVQSASPMTLVARGVGVFPDARKPRVLWAGLSGDTGSLVDFHRVLEDNLKSVGLESDGRPFKAHITLGRIKKGPPDPGVLGGVMRRHAEFRSEPFRVDRLVMYKSLLNPSGPVYTRLAAFDF